MGNATTGKIIVGFGNLKAVNSEPSPTYFVDWPGKSATTDRGREHPAACHMLDVAAVAEVLIAATAPDLPPGRRDLFCLLVALHDLGKIGARFRAMLREGADQGRWRHWQVTEAWLRAEAMEDLICDRIGGDYLALQPLVAAIAGHHGGPPRDTAEDHGRMRTMAGAEAAADARAFVGACLDLWPLASLDGIDSKAAMRWSRSSRAAPRARRSGRRSIPPRSPPSGSVSMSSRSAARRPRSRAGG